MPDVRWSPINQCSVDHPDEPLDNGSPVAPASPGLPAPSAAVASSASTAAVETQETRGSDALVSQFRAGDGPSTSETSSRSGACFKDDLRAFGTCGAGAFAAFSSGGVAVLFSAAACAAAIIPAIECHQKE